VIPVVTVTLIQEQDVVNARQRARQVAHALGFDIQDQTRFATAVSELARNAYEYAHGGIVEFLVDLTATPCLIARVTDHGPGIKNLSAVLAGTYVSPTGMGVGIMGARRLSDHFAVHSSVDEGTQIEIGKLVPRRWDIDETEVRRIAQSLSRQPNDNPYNEIQRQNQELVLALEEGRQRQSEADRLNAELAETNRGVLALYAELDDRAADLKRVSEAKTSFLSEMSHELRTPLASIMSLTWLLLDRADGDLTTEQEKQVLMIRRAGQSLSDLVNDLLDLAKIEAGAMTPRISDFTVVELFAALRGMFRPLMLGSSVSLIFDEGPETIIMHSDEGRVSQILRNFVSNAIKFTERGEIVVRAVRDGTFVRFEVRDTGLGIAEEDRARIFREFEQVDNSVQRRVRGTGLGLPVSSKLARLLGGAIDLQSTPGVGSTFSLRIPIQARGLDGAERRGATNVSGTSANGAVMMGDAPEVGNTVEDFA